VQQNIPNGRKIDQKTNIFHCKTLPNLPKLGLLVWKYAIWQPCKEAEVRNVKLNYLLKETRPIKPNYLITNVLFRKGGRYYSPRTSLKNKIDLL
jgi:hypothetical protein